MEDGPQPLDWRDDLLYREPPPPTVKSAHRRVVQIVSLDDGQTHDLKAYPDEEAAARKKELIEEDLEELTRSQFATKYRLPW